MMDSDRRLRIGVLGCGQISQAAHFEACRKAANTELYAICDLADDLRERMAVVHRPRVAYARYEEMLADPLVDAVIIAIADQFHVPRALAALAAGKHVFVEKPMGVSVEEVEQLRRAARDSGLVVQVGTNKRFDPGISYARTFIQQEIGELIALKAWYCDSTYRYTMTDALQPEIETSSASVRPAGDPKADRRRYYLLGHGSHLVDTARFLGGDIEAVRARLLHRADAWCWFVETRFSNGALGHLDLTIAVRMDWHEGFQIYGSHGSVIGKTYNPWYLRGSEVECFSVRDGAYHRPLAEDGHSYRRQIEGFAATILHGEPQLGANADDGARAIRALAAIQRSTDSGDWVRLDDVDGAV